MTLFCRVSTAPRQLERVYHPDTTDIRLGARQPPAAAATGRLSPQDLSMPSFPPVLLLMHSALILD